MKMITKIGLILSLLFFVLGLGSVTAAVALGVTWQIFTNAVDKGEFAIITNNTLPRPFHTHSAKSSKTDSSRQYYYDVENLDIQLGKGNLNILETDEDEISVEVLSDSSSAIRTELEHGTLKISGAVKREANNTEVRIYLPEDEYFDKAYLDVGAATVNVENLDADELEVKLGAGVLSSTGDIISEKSKWEIGVGEIDLNYLECEDTEIECGMGSVSLTMPGSQEDYDYDINCGAGTVDIGTKSYSTGHHTLSVDDADDEVDIKCGMGTVDLKFLDE